jgi:uncharacterized membrane protein
MSNQQWWLASMLLACVTLTIALWLTLLGYWPIMVAAILHLLLAGFGLRKAIAENRCSETICIENNTISVRQRQHLSHRHWQQALHWLRLEWRASRQRDNPALILHADGRQLELGAFLTSDEKAALLLQLHSRLDAQISAHDLRQARRLAETGLVSRAV